MRISTQNNEEPKFFSVGISRVESFSFTGTIIIERGGPSKSTKALNFTPFTFL
jgi:hypothetical protein